MPADESTFPGIYELDVEFQDGPKQGDRERHKVEFLSSGLLILHVPPLPGSGRWSIDGETLSFDLDEVVLGEDGKPTVVVHVDCTDAKLTPDGNGFEGASTASVYAAEDGLNLVATQRADQVARRLKAEAPASAQ